MNDPGNFLITPQRRVWMTLERDFKKRGAALLHQQCGLWGYDVRREVGGIRQNALLELGFERTPPPSGILGATTYARLETNGVKVTLWGFGMRFGDAKGGVFLSRFAFWPRYCHGGAPHHAWMPAQLLETHRAPRRAGECLAALDYFRGAMQWIADYEGEIEAHFGPKYRAGALQGWMKTKNGFSDLDIGGDWEQLAANCAAKTRFYCRNRGENRSLARAEVENSCRRASSADGNHCGGR